MRLYIPFLKDGIEERTEVVLITNKNDFSSNGSFNVFFGALSIAGESSIYTKSKTERRQDFLSAGTITKPFNLEFQNLFSSIALNRRIEKEINTFYIQAKNKIQAYTTAIDVKGFIYSWFDYKTITPTNPSFENITKVYYIYQDNSKRTLVSSK